MWERFKFWMSGQKDCNGCCLGCSFFEDCKSDVVYERTLKEEYEKEVVIEAIIKERIIENKSDRYHRKTA